MADLLSLSAEFPEADEARWRELAAAMLKGKSIDTLASRTPHGVPVKPLYRETDWPSAKDPAGAPGVSPFVRGAKPAPDPFLPWDIRQSVVHPDPDRAAVLALEALEGGASSIELRIDAHGDNGVCARDAATLGRILADVRCDLACVAFETAGDAGSDGLAVAALAATTIGAKTSPDNALIAFNVDPIGALARTGAASAPAQTLLAPAAAFATEAGRDFPLARLLRADARPVHEAGGTEVQELAFLVAAGVDYMRAQIAADISVRHASRNLLFSMSVGPDVLVEMAKLRAARRLWSRIVEALGGDPPDGAMSLQAVTSRRMLTQRDPWVNMLRNTAACFAAGVGGADIVTVRPFTDALGLPSSLSRRIARNTQIIAQEESYLGRVGDPAGGAWTMERLSEDLAKAAWTLFQEIEAEGGLVRALELGRFQEGVAAARQARMEAVARRKEWVTGVTDFPLIGELTPDTETCDVAQVLKRAPGRTGRRPEQAGWRALAAAARDGATLDDLAPPAEAQIEAEPLWPIRVAASYEALRDLAEARATTGSAPRIFLACLGPLADHSARMMYAQNFFASGGIAAEVKAVTASSADFEFEASGLILACICGSDEQYAAEAVGVASALQKAGAVRIFLAGRPGPLEFALREAGVADFIHIGVNVLERLEQAHAELGLGR